MRTKEWMSEAWSRVSRRDLFKAGSVAWLTGGASTAYAKRKALYEDSIYTRMLGVRPIVACRGHTTAFGGSLMPDEVMRAMNEANDCFPHPRWPKREVLIQKPHRVIYDRAYRAAGMTLREFVSKEEMERAIGENTAMLAALASTENNAGPAVMTIPDYIAMGREQFLAENLQGIAGFTAADRVNRQGFGEVRIDWDQNTIPLTGKQAAEKLYHGEPRLIYYEDDKGGVLQTRCMKDGDEIVAARILRRFFTEAGRRPA
jgi:hypothetical protein